MDFAETFKRILQASNFKITINALLTEVICEQIPSSFINVYLSSYKSITLTDLLIHSLMGLIQ